MNKNLVKLAEIIKANRSGEQFSLDEVMEIATQAYGLGREVAIDEVIKIIDEKPFEPFKFNR